MKDLGRADIVVLPLNKLERAARVDPGDIYIYILRYIYPQDIYSMLRFVFVLVSRVSFTSLSSIRQRWSEYVRAIDRSASRETRLRHTLKIQYEIPRTHISVGSSPSRTTESVGKSREVTDARLSYHSIVLVSRYSSRPPIITLEPRLSVSVSFRFRKSASAKEGLRRRRRRLGNTRALGSGLGAKKTRAAFFEKAGNPFFGAQLRRHQAEAGRDFLDVRLAHRGARPQGEEAAAPTRPTPQVGGGAESVFCKSVESPFGILENGWRRAS